MLYFANSNMLVYFTTKENLLVSKLFEVQCYEYVDVKTDDFVEVANTCMKEFDHHHAKIYQT